jgi:hypothetical protein
MEYIYIYIDRDSFADIWKTAMRDWVAILIIIYRKIYNDRFIGTFKVQMSTFECGI